MYQVKANILIAGSFARSEALKGLPLRVLAADTAKEAIRYLREEKIDAVVSEWELDDMPNGKFMRNIRAAKPATPTITFITPGNTDQEIAARSLGISVVLNEDIDNECFCQAICQLLAISPIAVQELVNKKSANAYVA